MKKLIVALSMLIGVSANAATTIDAEVPLIDRAIFFDNPEIAGGQLSPDGQWVSFLKEYNGILNIWVKHIDEPFTAAKVLTDSERSLYSYFWSRDSQYILYSKDNKGDENFNIFVVNPNEATNDKLPESRNLTNFKNIRAIIYAVSKNNPDLLMIGLNDRDKAWHDIYKLYISSGKLEKIHTNTNRITGVNFDWDDNLRIMYTTDEQGNTQFLRKDADDKFTPIYEISVTENASIISWNEDNSKIYLATNKGELNLLTLYSMDINSLELTKLEDDPEQKADFGGLIIDRNTRKIIASHYTVDKTKVYWQNQEWQANYELLQNKFPEREISFQSYTNDYAKFLVSISGDKYASETYLFDNKTKELTYQYTPKPKLKEVEAYLTPMLPISYKSSDDLEIPAYLTVPVNTEIKNLPLVVNVHGGPKGPRDYWGYDSLAQFLANRGYAVLQPNFRASGGFGKDFLNAGDLQWGKLMQDDITWGVKYLIDEGVIDKDRVVIMGGSYGGYATLAGLAFTPELYAGGVDIVGPSNIFTLLDSVPEYWESGRAFLYGMVGDPKTEEGRARIKEASPLFSVDKINRPLLIIQGANDPRVKQAEADQIVIALRNKNKKVDYLLADNEGHGYSNPINRMAMYAEIEKFLAEIIGGRYQETMPTDVEKRLKELTIDINTVTYDPKN